MAAFTLIPKNLIGSDYEQKLNELYYSRGFVEPKVVDAGHYKLICYGGIADGRPNTLWQDQEGNFQIITGTLIYNGNLVLKANENLFREAIALKINSENVSGTFCIVSFDKQNNNIHILHDHNGSFRFYSDLQNKLISTSFSVLAKASDIAAFDHDIIRFNLIFGFTPASKTWVKSIVRVLKQEQLPSVIRYNRLSSDTRKWIFKSSEAAVKKSTSLLLKKMNIGIPEESIVQKYLGLSSGYDSRLIAALLNKTGLENTTFFTFNKPGAADPVIAGEIAKLCKLPLKKKVTGRVNDYVEQEIVYQNAFRFFDGQAVTMMQYSKPDYTAEFRKEIFGVSALHLSGVGGELFRNYNFDHKATTLVENWMNVYLLNGINLIDYIREDSVNAILEILKNYLEDELEVFIKINYDDRKRFYGNLMLRDWHSVRNSVENQYSYYYTPFTDPAVINLSYATAKFHGSGGKFEGKMIHEIDAVLASLPSGYGYPLNKYPAKAAIMNKIRGFIKRPVMIPFQKSIKNNKKYMPTPFEENQLAIFDVLDLGINKETFLSSSKRVEPLLATAYSLNQLINV